MADTARRSAVLEVLQQLDALEQVGFHIALGVTLVQGRAHWVALAKQSGRKGRPLQATELDARK